MNESLKVIIEFHICHKSINYYLHTNDGRKFNSLELFCTYITTSLNNENNIKWNEYPITVRKFLFTIVDELNIVFGFSKKEMLELVVGFYSDKLWMEYNPIVLPLKELYDSII